MKRRISLTLDKDIVEEIDNLLFSKLKKVKKAQDLKSTNRSYIVNKILKQYFLKKQRS